MRTVDEHNRYIRNAFHTQMLRGSIITKAYYIRVFPMHVDATKRGGWRISARYRAEGDTVKFSNLEVVMGE